MKKSPIAQGVEKIGAEESLESMAGDTRAADVMAEAHAAGGDGAQAAPAAPAAPQLSPAEEWSQVPAIFGRILSRWFPEVGPIYSEEACMAWGNGMVQVAERYGWTPSKFFAWLGPWVGLAIATEALATPTYQALQKRYADAKAAAEKQAAQQQQ